LKEREQELTISDLLIPIASSFVFIILCFAEFIPMVKSAFEYMAENERD
jgi:hypothetical protein